MKSAFNDCFMRPFLNKNVRYINVEYTHKIESIELLYIKNGKLHVMCSQLAVNLNWFRGVGDINSYYSIVAVIFDIDIVQ